MLLVLDVGNTQTVCGIYAIQDNVVIPRRSRGISSIDIHPSMIKRIETQKLLSSLNFGKFGKTILKIAIASVVPSLDQKLKKKLKTKFKKAKIYFLTAREKHPIKLNVKWPKEVGADRLANMIAAVHLYRPPLFIVDFGTATTIDYVDAQKAYQGGVIMPGLKVSADSLFQKAEKLKSVAFKMPKKVMGKTTADQIQSGIIFAHAAMVEGMLHRLKKEIRRQPKIILTGGWASLIKKCFSEKHRLDPFLTLKGLRFLMND